MHLRHSLSRGKEPEEERVRGHRHQTFKGKTNRSLYKVIDNQFIDCSDCLAYCPEARALEHGAAAFLQKPVKPDELIATIHEVLKKKT